MASRVTAGPILVVEDEGDIRALIGYNLGQEGYEVALAEDLSSARKALKDARPHMVILDLMLPDGSGVELAKQIRENPTLRDVPILFVTAQTREDDLRSYEFSSLDGYLPKPFSIRELLVRVESQLSTQNGAPAPNGMIS